MQATGLKLESFRFKDFSHEKVFGSAPYSVTIKPLGRDTSGIPVIYQGKLNTCVACSVTWIRQWMEKNDTDRLVRLSWPFLADIAHIGPDGAAPSQVLEPARKIGICKWDTFFQMGAWTAREDAACFKIPSYTFITDYSTDGIYTALERGLLAIGVLNWKGRGDHMMVAYDVTDDGKALKAKSWWDEDHQTEEVVEFSQVEVAVSFAPLPKNVSREASTIPFIQVLIDKIISFLKY